ncbi:MAG: hypothetical protein AAGA96_05510 [Verrucomicrobiota bacterium]
MTPCIVSVLLMVSIGVSEEAGELIFSDQFERSESQETTDEPGNGWVTNSQSRANGNKQVDLEGGAMRIYMHETADHAVSVKHDVEFQDGAVNLRFKLENPKDSLGLNFADLKYKKVHAGHLFVVKITPTSVTLQDLKTGNMDLEVRTARKANALTEAHQEKMKGKSKSFPTQLEIGKWHEVLVEVEGDVLTVSIDGEQVGKFQSEGIAHPTKRALRLAVPREVWVDELKIWKR